MENYYCTRLWKMLYIFYLIKNLKPPFELVAWDQISFSSHFRLYQICWLTMEDYTKIEKIGEGEWF